MTRLLVVRLSALGDVIHAIPAVVSLRDSFDEIHWVVERPYAELVEIVAGVTPIPVRLKKWSREAIKDARKNVKGFDVAIDFQGLLKSALLTRASGARDRYGFSRRAVREKPAALFYNHKVDVDQTQHVVDWNKQLAAAVGDRQLSSTADWKAFPPNAHARLTQFTNSIVLLPGAGRPEKLWPVERFRDLVARYRDTVVVPGPGERAIAEQIGGPIAPDTNLRELAFVLQHAKIVIGGDTGPLHLADALGTRVVGLYGPTDPRRNGPYNQPGRTIKADSMDAISAAEFIRKIEEVLAK